VRRLAATLLLAAAATAGAQPADWDADSTCVTCHEAEIDAALAVPVPEWRDSVHAEHQVSCDACHGGDPRLEDADESMSPEAGFLDDPSWTEMADYCGICHEAVAESYRAGHFGRIMQAGVLVPTCDTCHMQDGHRILASQPEQLVTRESCPGCPGVEDPERGVALLLAVRAERSALAAAIDGVERKGIELSDFRAGMAQVHDAFERALHEFDSGNLDAARALAVAQYRGLAEQVAGFEREADGRRRLGLALLAALALMFAALWNTGRPRE